MTSSPLSGEIFLKIRIRKNDNKLSSQVLKRIQIEEGKKDHLPKKACEIKLSLLAYVVVSYVRAAAKIKFTNSCRTL